MASRRRLFKHSLKCNVLQSPIMTIVYYYLIKYFYSNFLLFRGRGPSAKGAGTIELGREGWRVSIPKFTMIVGFNGVDLVEYGVLFILKTLNPANHPPVRPGRNLPVGDSHVFRILVGHVGRAWFPVPAVVGWLRRPRWDRPGVGLRSGCCSGLAPGCIRAAR